MSDIPFYKIRDNLYLSSLVDVLKYQPPINVKFINLSGTRTNLDSLYIEIEDSADAPINDYIDNCINLIDDNEITVVFCRQGISRSVTIIIAYLLEKGLFDNYQDALSYVRSIKDNASPNFGFMCTLVNRYK